MDEPMTLQGMERVVPRSARILLEELEIQADIGFHDFEIGTPQRVLVTVEVWLDRIPSADCDDPASAWDYDYVKRQVEELAASRRYNLQESLANAIFARLSAMHGVRALRVATAKPDIYPHARSVGVELSSIEPPGLKG